MKKPKTKRKNCRKCNGHVELLWKTGGDDCEYLVCPECGKEYDSRPLQTIIKENI